MSLNKRIKGDFIIESIDSTDKITMHQGGGITISGDLTVEGTTTSVESTDTTVVDNKITLNSGEPGVGVGNGTGVAGIEIDRGTGQPLAGIHYDEASNEWLIAGNTGVYLPIVSGGGGITAIVQDTDPHLGGDLIVGAYAITSEPASDGDVVINADGTGLVKVEKELTLKEQATPAGVAGYNKLSAGTTGAGGTGLYFANDTETDELVSKSKAIIYGIIF